jgi:hypothetical protein
LLSAGILTANARRKAKSEGREAVESDMVVSSAMPP